MCFRQKEVFRRATIASTHISEVVKEIIRIGELFSSAVLATGKAVRQR